MIGSGASAETPRMLAADVEQAGGVAAEDGGALRLAEPRDGINEAQGRMLPHVHRVVGPEQNTLRSDERNQVRQRERRMRDRIEVHLAQVLAGSSRDEAGALLAHLAYMSQTADLVGHEAAAVRGVQLQARQPVQHTAEDK